MTDDEIRLFNEIMGQPGGEIEGLATSFPSIFEVPSITKDDALTSQVKDMIRKAAAEREAKRQADFASRPFSEKVKGAGEAASFLGSAVGRSMAEPFVELYGEATGRKGLGKEFVEAGFAPDKLPKTDLGLEYTVRTGEALEPVGEALEASKLPHGPFMPELVPLFSIPAFANRISLKTAGDSVVQDAGKAAKVAQQSLGKAAEVVWEEFATPPIGAISVDALGFSSRLSESVDKLQDKGTGPQFLAQLKKMKGVPQKEIEATGLDQYLQGAGKVTKEDVQDFLSTNRVEVIEDERFMTGKQLHDESKRILHNIFDWLEPEDLDEVFEDVGHLRNTMIRSLDRYIDDIEQADYDGPRQSSRELFEWRDEQIDKIDTEIGDYADEIRYGGVDYGDGWMLPGGENYREILYKLPEPNIRIVKTENKWQVVDPNNNVIQTFNKEDFSKANQRFNEEIRLNTFRPTHYTNSAGTFGSIRATDRDIDGKPVLFAEEIQSDWAIAGAKEGYRAKDAERIKGKAVQDKGPYPLNQGPYWEVQWEDGTFSGGYNQASAEEVARQGKPVGVPENPFRGNWYKPVVNNFLVKAAKEGKQGIGFPTGKVVSHRYDLSHEIDEINVIGRTDAVTGEKSRSVALDTVDGQSIRLGVDNDGKVDNVNVESAKRFLGRGLDEVIGKDLAKKIMEGGSQTISGEGLKVGGEGKDKLYDEMIPKQLKEIGDKYGVNLEKRTLPFGEKGATESEVYFFPITEEMRADLLNQGLPMFAEGGHVQKYAKGGSALKGIAKGAKQAAKEARRTPQLEQFLEKSQVKEQMYRGQRRAPQATGFALTQGRGTPSFTTDPEVANVYSRQLGWGTPEYGSGSTVMPAYLQMENPLDLRALGEHFNLSEFVESLPNVDLNQPHVENGFGYSDIAEMIRGIGSVAGKTGAQYEIEAASPGTPFRIREFNELADAIEDMGEAGKSETIDSMLFDTSIDAFLIGDSKNVRNALKGIGYDGVIHKDAFDVGGKYYEGDASKLETGTHADYVHDSYRPFFQEKIKSSIGNVGEYDTTQKDITKAKGGALKAAGKGAKTAEKQLKALKSTLEKAKAAERTPVMPAPNRWFLGPEKFPGPQKVLERAIEASGRPRESFVSGAYIDPRTGQVLDSSVMSNVIVGIDPDTGRPVMSGLSAPDLTLPGREQGPQTLSNLVRRNLYEPLEPGGVLDQTPFIATIEKSGPGHIYGLSTEYETPVELYNTKGTGNPTLRPKSRGDIYGLGDVVGQMRIKGRQKPHDVWEKLLVVPKGQTVKGGTKLGGGLGVMMMEEEEEGYNKGGALRSAIKGARKASDQIKGQKMLQGVYRGYTGERLEEPVLSTTPQKRVAEYYANRRAAERGEDPHLEMLMVDPFAGKQYGLSLPIDQYNRDFITTRARAITPEDVAERIQLKKRGGLASLSR